jgi:uncharacterized membrane protein YsdA (DUF1294 family)
MTDYAIILMVTVIAFVACAILAVVVYRIDKNADRRESRN